MTLPRICSAFVAGAFRENPSDHRSPRAEAPSGSPKSSRFLPIWWRAGSVAALLAAVRLGVDNVLLTLAFVVGELSKNCSPTPALGTADPNEGLGPQHGSDTHNSLIEDFISKLPTQARNIRKAQQQVDVNGNAVGTGFPDVQYDLNGVDHNVEFDMKAMNTIRHFENLFRNDPASVIELTF